MRKSQLGILLLLGLFCLAQVDGGRRRRRCDRKYHVSRQTQARIEDIKESEAEVDMESDDNCSLDGCQLVTDEQAQILQDSVHREQAGGDNRRKKRKVINRDLFPDSAIWDTTAIAYNIDRTFSNKQEANIRSGLEHITEETCFTFIEVDDIDDALLYFDKDQSCLTYLGREERTPHRIYLNAECANKLAEVVHQVLHALGIWHEHQRGDRGQFVKVNTENMKDGEQGNFAVFEGLTDTLGFPYDYTSVMHFKSTQFAKDGPGVLYTLEPVGDPLLIEWWRRTIGQRVEMSFFDSKQLNLVYCWDICAAATLTCSNGGYPDPNTECSSCRCPHGFSGTNCDIMGAVQSTTGLTTLTSQLSSQLNGNSVCGGTITAGSSTTYITSPGYGMGGYTVGTDCTWYIEAPENTTIQLKFEGDFSVYCRGPEQVCYHWVEIRTEANLTLPGVRFCCDGTPNVELTSVTNHAMVTMKSLWEDVEDNERGGFQLGVRADLPDPCETLVCKNGGTCFEGICQCSGGFSGDTCDQEDFCYAEPCRNGGRCELVEDGFQCICAAGYIGELCEDADLCHTEPCENGGLCKQDGAAYSCTCPDGFIGDHCERVDPCYDNPCVNGDCSVIDTGFHCTCHDGYTGILCDELISSGPCGDDPCDVGINCVENTTYTSGYVCTCPQTGFVMGPECQESCGGCNAKLGHLFTEVEPCYQERLVEEAKCVSKRVSYRKKKKVPTATLR